MEFRKEIVRNGVSFGSALSICISWSIHKSVLWAIVHVRRTPTEDSFRGCMSSII